MKDYYIPDFERKSFKNEDQDRFKPLYYLSKKTPYNNSFKESWYAYVCCCDWRIARPSMFHRGSPYWFISGKNAQREVQIEMNSIWP